MYVYKSKARNQGIQKQFDMHKAIVKHFHFRRSLRSLEIIRRPNTGFVAATAFPGFLAFN